MTLFILFMAAGIVLLISEMFLPGLIAGIIGVFCLVAAMIWAFIDFGADVGLWICLTELFLAILVAFLWISYFPNSRLGRIWSLHHKPPLQISSAEHFDQLLGATGETLTPLRQAGTILIEGKRYDAVAESSFITAHQKIKVVKVEGAVITVRAI